MLRSVASRGLKSGVEARDQVVELSARGFPVESLRRLQVRWIVQLVQQCPEFYAVDPHPASVA